MLRVRTYIKPSDISGFGLFAAEDIPKGKTTWQYDPQFDLAVGVDQLQEIPSPGLDDFIKYTYFDYSILKYILCADNQRFINHSNTPNIQSTPDIDIAARDIYAHEELTCDYTHFQHDWFERHGVDRSSFR